jgi:uncharacterized protein YjiS (DUF1127 family)
MATNWTLTMPRRRGVGDWFALAIGGVSAWQARARERRALAELDEHLLRDIGLDRLSAQEEAAKPFWER